MAETIDLVQPDEYVEKRPQLFPSRDSFNWFVRKNRDELVKGGAMIRPTGRWLINPTAFDDVILAIGARRAGEWVSR